MGRGGGGFRHEMPFGAAVDQDGVRFRLWAPDALEVRLRLAGRGDLPMAAEPGGWFGLRCREAGPGVRYGFLVDGGPPVPDPASRLQPDGVHGPSEVVDPLAHEWRAPRGPDRPWRETVLYELHVGTFSPEGTFDGVRRRLDHLADLGATAVELMPVAQFAGRRNWGYDGVLPFAPHAAYGGPAGMKRLVDAAHERGLAVFLDVVQNHLGPEGNHLPRYASPFFSRCHRTPWGAAPDFARREVRDFFLHHALYWLGEYRLDGLRLDAVDAIRDESEPHFLEELSATVRERVRDRRVHLVLENDGNDPGRLGSGGEAGRYDAQWCDDRRHALSILLTGETAGPRADFADEPLRHLGRSLAEGFAAQGGPSRFRGGRPRGAPSAHLPPTAFVAFVENHDQPGSRPGGERLAGRAPAPAVEAALAVTLLAPSVPLLFMGEEWGAETPFPFFCDFPEELARAVREGRERGYLEEWGEPRTGPDPNDPATFGSAVLAWKERDRPAAGARLRFVRRLLRIRRREVTPRLAGVPERSGSFRISGGVLAVCWTLGDGATLRLVANLSGRTAPAPAPPPAGRPLFAMPEDGPPGRTLPPWSVRWLLE